MMSEENTREEHVTLGAFLRSQREQKGISLSDATGTTRISPRILAAIEDDDFDKMPADAFCRGFYTIYAKFLELDKADVLGRYDKQRGITSKKKQALTKPPVRKSNTTPNYAEPAAFSPGFTISLIIGIIAFILLCTFLYFGWNPLSVISSKIPLFNSASDNQEITLLSAQRQDEPANTSPNSTLLPQDSSDGSPVTQANDIVYTLKATFTSYGTLQITLDNGLTENKQFFSGETLTWAAKDAILLSLPEIVSGTLTLNGVDVPLPAVQDGKRSMSLPEDLLDQ